MYCPDYDGLDFIMPGALGPDPSPEEIERTKALYYGEVTFVDRWVGHLLEKVDALGLRDETAIVVLSDHGTQVWDHGGFGKGGANLRRYNTGIVWQMRIPGQAAQQVDAFVQSHDVMPTLLELADVRYDRMEGTSVLPLVRGDVDALRDSITCGWASFSKGNAESFCSVRTPQYNYITPVHACNVGETLYDLVADPEESTNVIGAHPGVAAELRGHVEGIVGQPIPAQLNEVCDPEPSPIIRHLQGKKR
jgi:arylsulfatase A-like enzyme